MCLSEFPQAAWWAVIWAFAQQQPISPIFRRNLELHTEYSLTSLQYHQGSVISTVQPLLWFFLHDLSNRYFLIYSRFSLVARGLRHHYDSVSHHTRDFFWLQLFLTLEPHDHVTYCQAQGLSGHTSPCGECALFILGFSPGTDCLLGWFSAFFYFLDPSTT